MGRKHTKNWDVVIIGAGASGIMAAITAARRNKTVLLLEQKDKPGKKILATGNGRCNYTNRKVCNGNENYYGDSALLNEVLTQFDFEDTINFFQEIGITPKEKNGYFYPNSMQAASVLEALLFELQRLGVVTETGCSIQSVYPNAKGFRVVTAGGSVQTNNLIFATGLMASPKLGSDGSAFPLIKQLGHHFSCILPALCGFYAEGMNYKKVSGVRCDAKILLVIEGRITKEERGELQLADYGLSGIPVFQISSPASHALDAKKETQVIIDFLPEFSYEEVLAELHRRFERKISNQSVEQALCGLLNQKLINEIVNQSGIQPQNKKDELREPEIVRLAKAFHAYTTRLVKPRDYSSAQVCTGGICTDEIQMDTLESRIMPGLFFAGELLNVDGICGGFNLQWAWSSGYVAGNSVN